MSNIPTAHNECDNKNKIAKVVLMPGDPLRAKFIAENYLDNVIQFTTVRNNLGYTGYYKGRRISVMSSGMGMPSIGIYSYELYNFYDVDLIIRVGSCGSYDESLDIYDSILVTSAFSFTNYAKIGLNMKGHIQKPDSKTNTKLKNIAKKLNIKLTPAKIYSSDCFYTADSNFWKKMRYEHDCMAVEMESFALFANAKYSNKKAACLLTVSDSLVSKVETTSKERETKLLDMIKIALEMAE